jgi:hypothetical protein
LACSMMFRLSYSKFLLCYSTSVCFNIYKGHCYICRVTYISLHVRNLSEVLWECFNYFKAFQPPNDWQLIYTLISASCKKLC